MVICIWLGQVNTFFKARPRSQPIDTSCSRDIWTTKTTSQNCECDIFTLQRESTDLPLVFTLKRALAYFWEMVACNTMATMMMNLRKRCRGDGQMSLSCLLTSVIRIFVAPPRHWCHLQDVNLIRYPKIKLGILPRYQHQFLIWGSCLYWLAISGKVLSMSKFLGS